MQYGDVNVTLENHVAVVTIQRPPYNFFDVALIENLADAFAAMDEDTECRALVLAADGKAFCAGANFSSGPSVLEQSDGKGRNPLYVAAVRLFSNKKPVVGAIHGAAIGGGLGLALVPDFRVTCPEASFAANFSKLGFHPGFGLTHTLPSIIGQQKAALMFYTGRRIKGDQAHEWGLADVLTSADQVRSEAVRLAQEIASCAPLAVMSVRATLRQGLTEMLTAVTDHEASEQDWQRLTEDFKEGVASVAERRPGEFKAR
ncbi:enoyl-CoA hydratase [Pseudohongiella acticola]|uniref:Enoyl-CoA hydratase n=1 Tax=Pseudohongiella acticola TaxID=1524254 RepID=A0A1E8CID1_9GAMM|nr:enoyl-CoA hydratase/isomerase family protein [Pseudohongiella acticola]OFE12139.1 enoyl-CoA hydratase [Pseudohongiella acticola]